MGCSSAPRTSRASRQLRAAARGASHLHGQAKLCARSRAKASEGRAPRAAARDIDQLGFAKRAARFFGRHFKALITPEFGIAFMCDWGPTATPTPRRAPYAAAIHRAEASRSSSVRAPPTFADMLPLPTGATMGLNDAPTRADVPGRQGRRCHSEARTGNLMPMVAIGLVRRHARAATRASSGGRKRPPPVPSSPRQHLAGLGFRHIDRRRYIPGLMRLGSLKALPRRSGLTSKVDPTVSHHRQRAHAEQRRWRPWPPRRRRLGRRRWLLRSIALATNALGNWTRRTSTCCCSIGRLRGLGRRRRAVRPAARGVARSRTRSSRRRQAISLQLLRAAAPMPRAMGSAARTPAVVQFMHHVGMGATLGYRQWAARTWGAYLLGPWRRGRFGRSPAAGLNGSPTSTRATRRTLHSLGRSVGMPLVILSGNPAHLKEDLEFSAARGARQPARWRDLASSAAGRIQWGDAGGCAALVVGESLVGTALVIVLSHSLGGESFLRCTNKPPHLNTSVTAADDARKAIDVRTINKDSCTRVQRGE